MLKVMNIFLMYLIFFSRPSTPTNKEEGSAFHGSAKSRIRRAKYVKTGSQEEKFDYSVPFHVVETANPCFYEQTNLIDPETHTDFMQKSKLDNSFLSQKFFQNATRPSNSAVSKEHSNLQSAYPLELNVRNLPSQVPLPDYFPVKKSQSTKTEEIRNINYSSDKICADYVSPAEMSVVNDCADESENSISHGRKVFKKKNKLNQFSRMGSFRGKLLFKKFGSSLQVMHIFFLNSCF